MGSKKAKYRPFPENGARAGDISSGLRTPPPWLLPGDRQGPCRCRLLLCMVRRKWRQLRRSCSLSTACNSCLWSGSIRMGRLQGRNNTGYCQVKNCRYLPQIKMHGHNRIQHWHANGIHHSHLQNLSLFLWNPGTKNYSYSEINPPPACLHLSCSLGSYIFLRVYQFFLSCRELWQIGRGDNLCICLMFGNPWK